MNSPTSSNLSWRRTVIAAALLSLGVSVPLALRSQPAATVAGPDALFAKCVKILSYGDLNQYYKPGKGDAVVALGLLGDERAVPILVEHLENEANDHLRMQIARSLSWIGSKAAVPALEASLRDKHLHVRKQAAEALRQITGKEYDFDRTGEEADRKRIMDEVRARAATRAERTNQAPASTPPAAPDARRP